MDNAGQNLMMIAKIKDFILIFTSIFYEALPFIVLGAVIAGVLEELLPQRLVTRVLPKNRSLAIGLGGILGLVFPMCECGIIPIMRRLLRKGLPLSCCVAYLLAGPVVNLVVLLSTYVAFSGMENAVDSRGQSANQMGGLWMMGFRAGVAYLVAIGTALVVEGLYQRFGNTLLTPLAVPTGGTDDETAARRPWSKRVSNISETALHDFIDITVFLILGALLAAFTRMWLTHDAIAELSRSHILLTMLAMMALAVVLCLCSEADAFVAASFVTMKPSAKLAFLVLGPMLDIKLYLMYTRVFRPRLIWTIFGCVIVQTLVYCYLVHLLWETYGPYLAPPSNIP